MGRGTRSLVGSTSLARDFFAGQYAKVVGETFDAVHSVVPDEDVAFVAGALTFLGRTADAQSCVDAWRDRVGDSGSARTLAAARFFLGVAYARAGDFDRSRELLVAQARARLRTDDPWIVCFTFQGLACHRYFTGKYRAAARHALRASKAAFSASFAYVQMLATDLRGHALVQLGQFHSGTALLEQAKSHAERLGFIMNVISIECSIAIYTAKFKVGPETLGLLESLLSHKSHDSYSRRMLQQQAAIQYAVRGRAHDATAALEQADRDALRLDARRAKITSLLARLHVTRFREGPAACAQLLDQTATLVSAEDIAFRTELAAFELYVGRALADTKRVAAATDKLNELRRRTEQWAASAALSAYDPAARPAFTEDELTPMLRGAAERDERILSKLLASGVLGPIPETLGQLPGRRIWMLAADNAVLIEDRGDIWARTSPPPWLPSLLRILALEGQATKEAIVLGLWGLRYRPERHDPLIRTTIHRTRAFLEPRGNWITVTQQGYGLEVELRFAQHSDALVHVVTEPDVPEVEITPRRSSPSSAGEDLLLGVLVRLGPASAPELAQRLGVSESTALRTLRRLIRAKKIVKRGHARATRYQLRS